MRALQAAAAVCLTLALLAVSSDGVMGRSLLASSKGVDMPRLTNDTLLTHLQAVATPQNELVFTTTSAWTPAILDMLKNFVYHMHAVGRDNNLMVISQDNGTCTALLELNVPCYLDELSPRSWEFPEGHRYGERPWDFGKIWWSLRLAQLGYASLYLDNDVAAVKDPLAADIVQSPYDLQGLSDFRADESPRLGSILDERCKLYRQKFDKRIPGGDLYYPAWEIRKNETSMRALTPCQSLGAYYVRPTPAAMKFLAKLSDWVVHTHTQQWDQAAWNEVVMAFLVGMGDEEPLRYRILPISQFMNLEVYDAAIKSERPVEPVLLHAGYLNGEAKKQRFTDLGVWRGDAWQSDMGKAGLRARRKVCGSSLAQCRGRRSSMRWLLVLALCGIAVGLLLAARRISGHGYSSLLPTVVRMGH